MVAGAPVSVAIIGGGFSGVMTLVQLIRQAERPIKITLIHSQDPLGRGVAYNTYSDEHVLNVETQNMSAFPDQPQHFLDWCKNHPDYKDLENCDLATQYLPRNVFGNYMDEVFKDALNKKPDFVEVSFIRGEAIDIDEHGDEYEIFLRDQNKVKAQKIIIATGNHPPAPPSVAEESFFKSPFYFGNPWEESSVLNLDAKQSVLIIGTGLTMVDVVLGLLKNKFAGKIYIISPKGFKILAHRPHHPQRGILDELGPPYELERLFSLFRKYVRKAKQHGESGETVVDAVRSKTQEIWQHLSERDKRRFLVHIRHLWGVARHRLPGHIHARIQELIESGKLEIIAGRLLELKKQTAEVKVVLKRRKDQQVHQIHVSRIINCTGPQTDILKMEMPLFQNMVAKKIIIPDEFRLGINAKSDGRLIDSKGNVSDRLFTIGSLLKGKLWESTAVPEIRMQAQTLAGMILSY